MTRLSRIMQLSLLSVALTMPALAVTAQEITWWTPNWGETRARELAAEFEAANPGITINLEITVSNGLQNRIEVALRSGTPPDLIDSSMQWVIPFAASGRLLSLEQFAQDNIDLPDLYEATLDSVRYEGEIYGLPYRAQTLALIYNKALYRDAGLDPENPPLTWDAFLEAAQAMTKTNAAGEQQYGLGVSGGGEMGNLVTRLVPFIWMNGGDVLNEDYTQAVVNSPEAVAAVEFYTKPLTELGIAPPSTLQNDGAALRRLFGSGTIAQYFSGQYDLPALAAEAPDIELGVASFPYPEGKEPSGVLSGWTFIVPEASPNHEATLKFVDFLMEPENQGFYTDTFPASRTAMDLPRFQEPLLQPFKEMLNYARPAPSSPAWIATTQILFAQVQEVLLGSMSAQEAMDEAALQIQDVLDR